MQNRLLNQFGNIDIYLFDQLLKGRYDNLSKVLDVGCGIGRNLHYFLLEGFDVFGIDTDTVAIQSVKDLSSLLAPNHPLENFRVGLAEKLPHESNSFDLVISSAVLHFARDEQHFDSMVYEMFRVLKPGGYFFARLASNIGIETLVTALGNNRYLLPDGSERYLVNEQKLLQFTDKLGTLYEPIKTTNVQQVRCMTTWCVRKY